MLESQVRNRRRQGCLYVVSVVLSGRVFASCLSLVQRIPTGCDVSECYREALIMRRPWSDRGCCAVRRKDLYEGEILVIVCSKQFKSLNIRTKETKIQHKTHLNKNTFS